MFHVLYNYILLMAHYFYFCFLRSTVTNLWQHSYDNLHFVRIAEILSGVWGSRDTNVKYVLAWCTSAVMARLSQDARDARGGAEKRSQRNHLSR